MIGERIEVNIDVTGQVPGVEGPLSTSVWVFLPPSDAALDPPIVLCAFPGGTHSKDYYDLIVDGADDYSMARYLSARGFVFVAADHLGSGGSSRPEPKLLDYENTAAGNAATVAGVLTYLVAEQPSVRWSEAVVIGVGHGMGSLLLDVEQARHRTYDAVAFLGDSKFHYKTPEAMVDGLRERGFGIERAPGDGYPPDCPPGYVYFAPPRFPSWRQYLFGDEVPVEIMDRDDAAMTTAPPFAPTMLDPGAMEQYVGLIDVPVFLCFGERDSCEDPYRETTAYRGSSDVTLFILPGSGHAHVLANGRRVFWDRLAAWARSVVPAKEE